MRRVALYVIVSVLVCFHVVTAQEETCSGAIKGVVGGNVTLGFLFPFRGTQQDGSSCSNDVVYQDNIQLIEAARFALQNAQGAIPGVNIGLEAYDTCASSKVGIERAVSFLSDRLVFVDQEMATCPGTTLKSGMVISGANDTGSSLGTFLSDAHLTHIGFDTTLSQFTQSDRYSYFARALPSDDYQAMALTNLIEAIGWNYVATFHSENPADIGALEAFKTFANHTSICISASESVKPTNVAESAFDSILRAFLPGLKPRVVVLFMPSDQLVQFFQAVGRTTGAANTIAQEIQWIVGSRGLVDISLLSNSLPIGTLGVRPVALTPNTTQDFDDFFKALTPENHDPSANPWFKTFWQKAYQCNLDNSTEFSTDCGDDHVQMHINSYRRNAYVPTVLDSFKILTEALKTAQETLCPGDNGVCTDLQQLSADLFYKYVVEVSTLGTANQQIRFMASGGLAVNKFTIVDCKTAADVRCTLEEIGSWEDGTLTWSDDGVRNQTVESMCGVTCLDPVCIKNKDALDREVYLPGDIILAGMFNVHPTLNPQGGDCGTIDEVGVQRLEAMLYALDLMNQDDLVLPGIRIGMEGIDTCGIEGRAGHLALQLISKADFKNSGSGEREGAQGNQEHLYAVVGPDGDAECIEVSDVLQAYDVPMVAYAAGSADLSNSYFYPNFARVIAPATNQISAILGAIYTSGWFYIQALHSSSREGWNGVNVLNQQAPQRAICLTQYQMIPTSLDDQGQWDEIMSTIGNRQDAKVLVLITDDPAEYRAVMDQLIARDMIGDYYLIATDGWPMHDEEFMQTYGDYIKGVTAVGKLTRSFPDFQEYFTNLDPLKNTRNPWFQEYWMAKFNCALPGTDSELPACTGSEAVPTSDISDIHIADVIDATYSVGKIIHTLRANKCPGTTSICQDAINAGGQELFNLLRNTLFNSVNDDRIVKFDFQGNGDTEFEMFNYQELTPGSGFFYQKVGGYRTYTYTQQGYPSLKVYDKSGTLIDHPLSECVGLCADCKKIDKGKVAEAKNGDAYIGGFFRLHELAENEHDCTDEFIFYNMQYLEAFLYAIDQVNADPDVLPNLRLGGVAFDTCGSEKRARRDAANFISATVEYRSGYPQNRVVVSGIIGEQTSGVTKALADVVTPLQVPQVSYAATSTALDNNATYPFFQRTVASDSYQADALIDLLIQMQWSYVSVVYSDDEYGNDIYAIFVEKANAKNICIAMSPKVTSGYTADEFQSVISDLRANPQANAVLLLTSDVDTRDLLRAAETLGVNDLQWVGTDTWGSRDYVTTSSPVTARGALTLQFREVVDYRFIDYYSSLNPYSNVRNPWWKLFISKKFKCNLYGYDVPQDYDENCQWTVQNELAYDAQEPEVSYIILAVRAFAVGLHDALLELCPDKTNHLCNEVMENPQVLQDKVRAARVPLEGDSVFQFDESGNGPALYDILNYQMTDTGLNYTKVGSWDSGAITLNTGSIKFYNGDDEVDRLSLTSKCTGRCSECMSPTEADDYVQIEGQLQIPGLFALHETGDHLSECGDFRLSGLLNLEAMLYAIKNINSDQIILPGVTLGTTSFDTCLSTARAVRDLSSLLSGSHMSLSTNQIWSSIVGVVGPETDDVTMGVAELTDQYKYTQVSYGPGDDVPSTDSYLYRSGPFATDNSKAMALVDILRKYNWMYVSVVYSTDSSDTTDVTENENDAKAFISAATASGICIATQQIMSTGNASAVVDNLLASEPSDVIVTFVGSNDLSALQIQLVILGNNARHLTWILAYPDSLSNDGFIIGGSGDSNSIRSFRGALAIKARETVPTGFLNYVKSLRITDNKRNPWFQEYIEKTLNCDTTGSSDSTQCPQDASIRDVDLITSEGTLVAGIIDSVQTIALGIHTLIGQKCPGMTRGMCADFLGSTPEEFRDAISSVSYTRTDGSISQFNDDHSIVPIFDVWNYQGPSGFAKVGSWQPGNLNIQENAVMLYKGGKGDLISGAASSICTERSVCDQCFDPTTPAVTTTLAITTPLVTTKEPTTPAKTTLPATTPAPTTKPAVVTKKPEPTPAKQTTSKIPPKDAKTFPPLPSKSARIGVSELTSTWFYVIIVFAVIGMIITLILIALVVIRWNEPIAQAMSPFLLLVVLIGLLQMFTLVIVFAVPVSLQVCGLQRFVSGLGFAMCHAGLFLMTVRIYRLGRHRTISGPKTSFIQTGSQMILFLFLSAFQVVVDVEWLILKVPVLADKSMPTAYPKISGTPLPIVEQECGYTTSELQASFIWVYMLLVLTLGVALVARRRISHMVSMSLYQIHTILLANIGSIIMMIIWVLIGAFADRDIHRPSISVLATVNAYIVLAALFIYRGKLLFLKQDPHVSDERNIVGGEYGMGEKKMDLPGYADSSHVSFENPIAMAATDLSEDNNGL